METSKISKNLKICSTIAFFNWLEVPAGVHFSLSLQSIFLRFIGTALLFYLFFILYFWAIKRIYQLLFI